MNGAHLEAFKEYLASISNDINIIKNKTTSEGSQLKVGTNLGTFKGELYNDIIEVTDLSNVKTPIVGQKAIVYNANKEYIIDPIANPKNKTLQFGKRYVVNSTDFNAPGYIYWRKVGETTDSYQLSIDKYSAYFYDVAGGAYNLIWQCSSTQDNSKNETIYEATTYTGSFTFPDEDLEVSNSSWNASEISNNLVWFGVPSFGGYYTYMPATDKSLVNIPKYSNLSVRKDMWNTDSMMHGDSYKVLWDKEYGKLYNLEKLKTVSNKVLELENVSNDGRLIYFYENDQGELGCFYDANAQWSDNSVYGVGYDMETSTLYDLVITDASKYSDEAGKQVKAVPELHYYSFDLNAEDYNVVRTSDLELVSIGTMYNSNINDDVTIYNLPAINGGIFRIKYDMMMGIEESLITSVCIKTADGWGSGGGITPTWYPTPTWYLSKNIWEKIDLGPISQ